MNWAAGAVSCPLLGLLGAGTRCVKSLSTFTAQLRNGGNFILLHSEDFKLRRPTVSRPLQCGDP